MTQPAVSRAIQELERYYGIVLFERINKRIVNTEAGSRFYSYALHILDSYDTMEKEMRNWDEIGVLKVGATVTLGSMLLPRVIREFKKKHPGIKIKASVQNTVRLMEALSHNELDLALIEGTVSDPNLMTEAFSSDRLILLLPPDCDLLSKESISLTDLSSYPHILRDKDSISRKLLDHIYALHGISVEPLMESISTHAIVQAVHEGIGISFITERLVKHSVESGFVASRAIEDEHFDRKNFIVYHKNKFLTESARDFMSMCRQYSPLLDL